MSARLYGLLEDALLAQADASELPLTTRDVQGLAHAAVAGLSASHIVLPRTATLLTEQELAMLRALADGEKTEDTSRRLCLSINTVKSHRRRMYRRLGASGAAHAVALGFAACLLAPPTPVAKDSADRLKTLLAPAGPGVHP